MTRPVELRRGGWFVIDEIKGCSGPWATEKAAQLAEQGRYDEAHAEERRHRTQGSPS